MVVVSSAIATHADEQSGLWSNWEATPVRELNAGQAFRIGASSDGRFLALIVFEHPRLRIWDSVTDTLVPAAQVVDATSEAAVLGDPCIAVAEVQTETSSSGRPMVAHRCDSGAEVWSMRWDGRYGEGSRGAIDVAKGCNVAALVYDRVALIDLETGKYDHHLSMLFASDPAEVALSGASGRCIAYELVQSPLVTPFAQQRIEARPAPLYEIDLLSKKRRKLMTFGPRGTWTPPAYVSDLAISPNGSMGVVVATRFKMDAASYQRRAKVELIDVRQRMWLREFPLIDAMDSHDTAAIWLDDDHFLIVADPAVFLVNARSGRYRELDFPFMHGSIPKLSVAYSSDKGRLFVANAKSVYLYDLGHWLAPSR